MRKKYLIEFTEEEAMRLSEELKNVMQGEMTRQLVNMFSNNTVVTGEQLEEYQPPLEGGEFYVPEDEMMLTRETYSPVVETPSETTVSESVSLSVPEIINKVCNIIRDRYKADYKITIPCEDLEGVMREVVEFVINNS